MIAGFLRDTQPRSTVNTTDFECQVFAEQIMLE